MLGPYAALGPAGLVGAALASSKAIITVSTPEAPNPTAATQINFDGSETINVQFTDGGLDYNVTFLPSNFAGTSAVAFSGASTTLSTPISTWQAANETFQVIGLQTGPPTAQSPTYSKYARVAEWTYAPQPTVGFQIVGDQTSAANMPATGTAQYVGQAYGQANNLASNTGATQTFTATSTWNVNFANNSLTGAITDFHIAAGGDPNLQKSAIGFSATLAGSSFTGVGQLYGTGFATSNVMGANGATVAGSFYGPSSSPAAEIGGAFSGSGVVGAFVGAPVSPPTSTAFPVTWSLAMPRVSYQADQSGANPQAYSFGIATNTFTIYDPDGSTAVTPIDLSGDEWVNGNLLSTSTYRTNTQAMSLQSGSGTRNLASQSWTYSNQQNCCVSTFTLYQLLVGQRPASGSLDGNPAPQYVQLIENDAVGSEINASYAFGVMGDPTPIANMPTTGAAVFNGEAYGRYFPWNSTVNAISASYTPFTAAAQVNANFGSGSVTGMIGALACPNACAGVPTFSVSFSGSISGSAYSGAATSSGGAVMSGSLAGGFYGPASNPAKETGGVFQLTGTGAGALAGGFVAGR